MPSSWRKFESWSKKDQSKRRKNFFAAPPPHYVVLSLNFVLIFNKMLFELNLKVVSLSSNLIKTTLECGKVDVEGFQFYVIFHLFVDLLLVADWGGCGGGGGGE